MYTTFTSTKSLVDASRLSLTNLQNRLNIAQKEVASGRYADMGMQLGSRVGRSVSLRQQLGELNGIIDTNSAATTRLDSMMATLTNITDTAGKFTSTLIATRNTTTGPGTGLNEARANLTSLIDNLNSSVGGEYLFAGIDNGRKPVASYFASTTPASRQAVEDAFTAEFGANADLNAITGDAMQSFLDGSFSALFDPDDPADPAVTGWGLWSTASDENMKSRISTVEAIESTSTANIAAYRKLAEAYTMVADLNVDQLNQSAYHAVVDTAMKLVGEAVQGLAVEQSRLGTAQARVESANTRMSQQIAVITDQINALETVDPNEASTRVNTLMTQMEIAYSLTARIQKLSILNYL